MSIANDTTLLPFPARKLISTGQRLVVSNFDSGGVAVVPIANTGATATYQYRSDTLSFAVGSSGQFESVLMWIEGALSSSEGPWLLWVNLAETLPTIREVPHSLLSHAGGVAFVRDESYGLYGFAYKDSNGRLHRSLVDLDSGVVYDFDLGVAPGGRLVDVQIAAAEGPSGYRAAYRFQSSDVTHVLIATDPGRSWTLPPPVVEHVGTWPGPLRDARWSCCKTQNSAELDVLTDDGGLFVWPLPLETVEVPRHLFGVLPASTQSIFTAYGDVVSIDATGHLGVLVNNGQGRAVAPQKLPIGPSCSVCTIGESTGSAEWFALDVTAVHGYLERVDF